jgi:predicted nuclease with RNAse H fold
MLVSMRTAGIDLSSQDKKTALCVISWAGGLGNVEALQVGVSDADIIKTLLEVDKAGIDVPLGWPLQFVRALESHVRQLGWPADYIHSNTEAYRYRRTDLHVWRTIGGAPPLSVSTDRIGITAMRAAALLSRMGSHTALDGSGVVIEVYPAAALRIWGFSSSKYKTLENAGTRALLVEGFLTAAPWMRMSGGQIATCRDSDDAFDAVVSACVARCAQRGLVRPMPKEDVEAAKVEGWIALPSAGSLLELG